MREKELVRETELIWGKELVQEKELVCEEKSVREEEPARELPKGLIKWYPFRRGCRALYVKGGIPSCEVLAEAMEESGLLVDSIPAEELLNRKEELLNLREAPSAGYDYIVLAGALERSGEPEKLLRMLRHMLAPGGRVFIGTDNRLGMRYFCGDCDAFTGRSFDGIENYTRVGKRDRERMKGRAYARAEIIRMLEKGGFADYRFYSVLPALDRPQAIYAEDYLPEEELDVRIAPQYHRPETVFLEEEGLYTTLIQNGLFHCMANGFLVECSTDGSFANMNQVTISMDRGKENGLATVIRRDGKVEKKPLYEEGKKKLERLMQYTTDLQRHGVKMVDARLEDGSYVMPYIQGEPATNYFRRLLCEDKERFLHEFDRFWELLQGSSEHIPYEEVDWENFDPAWKYGEGEEIARDYWKKTAFESRENRENLGVILDRGYIDLVSLNCFFTEGDFVFYDQEFYCRQLPAKAILMRTIDFIYWGMTDDWKKSLGNTQMEAVIPRDQIEERYHMKKYRALFHAFSDYFIYDLTNGKELSEYHRVCRRDMETLRANRYRMNYSEKEYRHFQDIFHHTKNRQIYLFGSGGYAKQFFRKFGSSYEIAGILDNNPEKWGTEWNGIPVFRPEYLLSLAENSYKVFICIKECIPVMQQLEEMGVREYSVYDYSRGE